MSDAITHALRHQECPAEQLTLPSPDNRQEHSSGWNAGVSEWTQLFRTLQASQERERSQELFLSAISHELKNTVTGIKLVTQRLGKWSEQRDDARVSHWCEQLDRQVMRITHIINDMFDLSRLQIDQFRLCKQPFFLNELVTEVVEDFQGITPTHRLLIESQPNILVDADKERIGQVLMNLLTNAIKHAPQAEVVHVSVTREQAHAIVRVQDFGVGIAAAHHERIFERFYQVSEAPEPPAPGLGLGLYLVRTFIELHQGKIWVESEAGQGATFVFCLPLSHQESDGR